MCQQAFGTLMVHGCLCVGCAIQQSNKLMLVLIDVRLQSTSQFAEKFSRSQSKHQASMGCAGQTCPVH